MVGRGEECRQRAQREHLLIVFAKLLAHLLIQPGKADVFVVGGQRTVTQRVLGVGDLLVENGPDFGLRPQVLFDFLQRALVLPIARLRWCRLVGDIEHGVSGLHGTFYLVEYQAFLALDARYIQ